MTKVAVVRGVVANEPFKHRVTGIIVLGVTSSLIATIIWAMITHRSASSEISVGPGPISSGSTNQPKPTGTSAGKTIKSGQSSSPDTSWQTIDSRSRSVREAIRDYNRSFVALSLSGSTSLEPLYHQAAKLGQLMTNPPDSGGKSFLERLRPQDEEALAQQLPGIVFYRHEITNVTIDSVFFLSLAKKSGMPADIEFFQNWRLTFPETTWAPKYIQQQTDYSGCTNYGNGEHSKLFAMWSTYALKYPGDYADDVSEQLDSIRSSLTQGTCACGTQDSVETELERFVSAFPNDRAAAEVTDRLHALRLGKAKIRFKCLSG